MPMVTRAQMPSIHIVSMTTQLCPYDITNMGPGTIVVMHDGTEI